MKHIKLTLKSLAKYLAFLLITLIFTAIVAFIFRDFLALKYANFFYFSSYPANFNNDDFLTFRQNLERNDWQNLPKKRQIPLESSAILNLGGRIESRIFQTIALYAYGISDLVLITNPANHIYNDFGGGIQSEVTQMQNALKFANVTYKLIPSRKDFGAQSTKDEALDLVEFLQDYPLESLIIVTSEFHSKRAYIIFNDIFEKHNVKTKIYLIPAPNRIFNRQNWHKSELGLMNYILELPKLLLYYANDSEISGVKAY